MIIKKFSIFLIAIFIISCSSEKVEYPTTALIGKWDLRNALRDGKTTKVLNGAYLLFENDSILNSNIIGDTLNYNFNIEDNIIHQTGNHQLDYTIDVFSTDTLSLTALVNGAKFNLLFLKDTIN